jgi:TetR/AcrR family transcriptional regulator
VEQAVTNDETTHGSILAAAIEVVADAGYSSASLAGIAGRAGVSPVVIEDEFPSKSMLMAEAAAWIYGDQAHYIGSRIEAVPEGLPRVQTYIRSMCAYYYENPQHLRALGAVIGSGELVGPPSEHPSTRRWHALADLLTQGQRHGLLGAFDARAVAIIIGGAIDGLIAEWSRDPTFDVPAAAEELADLVSALTRGAVFAR